MEAYDWLWPPPKGSGEEVMPRRHSLSISSDAADQTRPLSTRYRYTTAAQW